MLQKDFIWSGKNPKIKHTTLIGDYPDGGLKDVDIKAKLKSLKLGWLKRLYSDDFHPWKNIPANGFVIKRYFQLFLFESGHSFCEY